MDVGRRAVSVPQEAPSLPAEAGQPCNLCKPPAPGHRARSPHGLFLPRGQTRRPGADPGARVGGLSALRGPFLPWGGLLCSPCWLVSTLVAPGPRTPGQQVTSKPAPSSHLAPCLGLLPLLTGGALALWSPSAGAGPVLQLGHLEGTCWKGWGGTGSFPLRPPAPWPDARSFQGVTLLRGLLLSALLGKTSGEIYGEFMALAAVLRSEEGQGGTVLGCRTTCGSPSSPASCPARGSRQA